jgi:hypothetical protein
MKNKCIITLLMLGIGLCSSHALASDEGLGGLFETSRHNIRITCPSEENCLYQAWNKPKKIGQGKPDMEIANGSVEPGAYASRMSLTCEEYNYGFTKGDTYIRVRTGLNRNERYCFLERPPKNAGDLTVYIDADKRKGHYNYKKKAHYWLFKK